MLATAPLSILIGFGLPSILMCLPAPTMVSFETKQTWTGIQQGWSIWIGITQFILTSAVFSFDQKASVVTESDKRVKTLKYLRQAYMFAILSSAGSHIAAWGLPLLAYAFPVLFSPVYLPQLQPARIFLPVLPFGPNKVGVLADGALGFLQWDTIVGVTATLLWALTLRASVKQENAIPVQTLSGAIKIVITTLALGPCGAAAVAMWSRDELVFEGSNDEATKDKSI